MTPALNNRTALAAVLASVLAVGLTIGMVVPLVTLMLEARGASPVLTGVIAATPALAMLAFGPAMPWVIARLGPTLAMAAGITVSALCLVLFPLTDSDALWLALRLALGAGMGLNWVVSEAWIGAVASAQVRGRTMALYATLWALGIAVGPQALRLTGSQGAFPFMVAAGLMVVALAPLALVRNCAPTLTPQRRDGGGDRGVWLQAPVGMAAAFVSGYGETTVFALLPIYGLRQGLDAQAAVLMLSMFALGGLVAQLPLGWLADRFDRRQLLIACAGGALGGCLLLPLATPTPTALAALLFVWGGAIGGFYALGLTVIGQRFQPESLARANVAFVMAYNLGMATGPASGGAALDAWSPHGLTAALALAFSAFIGLALWHQD